MEDCLFENQTVLEQWTQAGRDWRITCWARPGGDLFLRLQSKWQESDGSGILVKYRWGSWDKVLWTGELSPLQWGNIGFGAFWPSDDAYAHAVVTPPRNRLGAFLFGSLEQRMAWARARLRAVPGKREAREAATRELLARASQEEPTHLQLVPEGTEFTTRANQAVRGQ